MEYNTLPIIFLSTEEMSPPVLLISIIITVVFVVVTISKYKPVKIDRYASKYIITEQIKQKKIKDSYIGTHTNKHKKMNSNK